MNKKYLLILIVIILGIIFIMNFNTILGALFPQDTSITVEVEETPYIKGGIVHIKILDSKGNQFSSNAKMNITMIDEKGNRGKITSNVGTFSGDSIYRYGGGHDEAWKDLSVYGKYTIEVEYPGELGYNPSNITKNITINKKEIPEWEKNLNNKHSSSSTSSKSSSEIFTNNVIDMYDNDGDGKISSSEWNTWCSKEGYAPMSDCDSNGDGYCSQRELSAYSHDFGY